MLIVPLGLEPQWVGRGGVTGGIYYGSRPGVSAAVRLAASERAPHFFAAREPYDAQMVAWFEGTEGHLPIMFVTADGQPDFLASTFLWLSGWQEMIADNRDDHGRVPYAASLSAMLEVPRRPVVDAYRTEVEKRIRQGGIEAGLRKWTGRDWVLCPTHDIDYIRKWRPGILYREFVQNLILNRRGVQPATRLRSAAAVVRQINEGDPYRRALKDMPEEVGRRGGTATYFFKAGGDDPHDVPYRLDNPLLEERFGDLKARGFEIGLHPSYGTPADRRMMANEAERIRAAAGEEVASIRQHYLRYDLIHTPRIHEALEFKIDSTVGFAEHEGFRRGTCLPFQLYDLEDDRPLEIWEMPLAVMDSALFVRRQLSLQAALDITRDLAASCRRYGGAFVVIWHNVLGDELDAPGWKEHFVQTLDYAQSAGGAIQSLSAALEGWS